MRNRALRMSGPWIDNLYDALRRVFYTSYVQFGALSDWLQCCLPFCQCCLGSRAWCCCCLLDREPHRIPREYLLGTKSQMGAELPDAPLIVFINSRSGGRAGARLMQVLCHVIGHVQASIAPLRPGPGMASLRWCACCCAACQGACPISLDVRVPSLVGTAVRKGCVRLSLTNAKQCCPGI